MPATTNATKIVIVLTSLFTTRLFAQLREIPLPTTNVTTIDSIHASPGGALWLAINWDRKLWLYTKPANSGFVSIGQINGSLGNNSLYENFYPDLAQPQDGPVSYLGIGQGVSLRTSTGGTQNSMWQMLYRLEDNTLTQVCTQKDYKFDSGLTNSPFVLIGPTQGPGDGRQYWAGLTGEATTFFSAPTGKCELTTVTVAPFKVGKFWKAGNGFLALKVLFLDGMSSTRNIYEVVQVGASGQVTSLATSGKATPSDLVPWTASLQVDPKNGTYAYTWIDQQGLHGRFVKNGVSQKMVDVPLSESGSAKYFRVSEVSGDYAIYFLPDINNYFSTCVYNASTGKTTVVRHGGDTVFGVTLPKGLTIQYHETVDARGNASVVLLNSSNLNQFKLAQYDTEAAILPVSVSLSADPASITAGASSKLCVTAQNAASVTIDQGVGSVDISKSPACVTITPAQTTTYTATAFAPLGGGTAKATATLIVTPAVPIPAVEAVTPLFAGLTLTPTTEYAPGQVITAWGRNLCGSMQAAGTGTLPTDLAGCSAALIDAAGASKLAGLYYVSSEQMNILIPNLPLGSYDLVVRSGTVSSKPVSITMRATSPNFVQYVKGGVAYVSAIRADGSYVSAGNPLRGGEVLILFGSGLGQTEPAVPDSELRAAAVAARVSVEVNGVPADVLFAGLQGQYPGLYQVNVRVPDAVVTASELRISVSAPDGTAQSEAFLLERP